MKYKFFLSFLVTLIAISYILSINTASYADDKVSQREKDGEEFDNNNPNTPNSFPGYQEEKEKYQDSKEYDRLKPKPKEKND